MSKQIQILLLSGSLRRPSHTLTNLETFAGLLQERGASVSLWDLCDDPLPPHNPLYHRDPHSNPSEAVRRLAKLADDADAFIWGTPVYHNSFSGALKNALDNLSIHQFQHKPVALISNGGDRSGTQPCDQLRIVARGLLAVALPTQAVTIESDFELHRDRYVLVNHSICERFVRLAEELIAYSALMRQLRS
jgi:NAD(P)H-dependent FMN reductase